MAWWTTYSRAPRPPRRRKPAQGFRLAAVLPAAAAFLAAGCAAPRAQGPDYRQTLRELQAEVASLPTSDQKSRIVVLIDQLSKDLEAAAAKQKVSPEQLAELQALAAAVRPVRIELGFATDGKDWDNDGYDDGVEVHLIPRDAAGSAIKSPGEVNVTLAEEGALGLGGAGKARDSWEVTGGALEYSWNESIFPSYVVRLPWHGQPPVMAAGILLVTFTPLTGEAMTVRKAVEVHVRQPAGRP